MSLSRCIDIEINGVQYPFHFGMSAITKYSKTQKWDNDAAIEILARLLTVSGAQKNQLEFHKMAATIGASMAGNGAKAPADSEIEESFFKIVNVTQNDIYPSLMDEMGIDAKPILDRIKKVFEPDPTDVK